MARNGSGIFELPLPPVEPDTVISSTWANQTLDDISNALSESLPVSGERGMTGPFRLADGSASNPAFAFNSEGATGLFRPSTNVIAFSVSGGERMRLSGGNLLLGRTTDDGTNILQVGGQAKFFSGVIVAGNLNVSTGATIGGDTTLGNVGFVNGSAATLNLTNRLDVFGDGITTNGIYVSGDQTITGTLGAGNVLALGVAAADAEFTTLEADTFQVNGTSALSNVNVSGNLTVVGAATLPILNSTTFTATTVSSGAINQTSTTGTGEINIGTGRTADGGSVLNFRTAAGSTTYNFRINRAGGANGSVFYQNTGSGRQQFENDTSPDFRWTTAATGGLTHKFTAPNLVQGADFSVHGVSLSSVGNVNFFFQNSAQTTTQNYYSVSRNVSAGIANHIFRTGGDASVNGSATTALTISETAVLPALQTQSSYLGTEIAPTYSFNGDNNTGMWRSASDVIDFSAGGVRKLQIDTAKITASVPVIAPQSVSGSFNPGQVFSTTAGFTLNTGMTVGTYTIYNNSGASIVATAGSGLTLRLSGTATTGNRTIAQRGLVFLTVLSSTEYVMAGTAVS